MSPIVRSLLTLPVDSRFTFALVEATANEVSEAIRFLMLTDPFGHSPQAKPRFEFMQSYLVRKQVEEGG